jgi:membrane protease YdiL (CAAX protease family)
VESLHPEPPVPAEAADPAPPPHVDATSAAEGHPPSSPPTLATRSPGPSLPAAPPAWWLLVLFLATLLPLLIFGFLMAAVQGGRPTLLQGLLGNQLAFLLPALAWARLSGFRPLPLLRLSRPSRSSLLLGVAVGLVCLLAGSGLNGLWRGLLPSSLLDRFDTGRELASQGWGIWQSLALVALMPAVCEEVAFRGALLPSLHRRPSPVRAIAVAAVIFAAAHFDPVRFPAVLLVGLALGWLAWRTGSTWPGVVAHALNNGAAVLVTVASDPAELASADPTESLPTLVGATLLFAGLALWAALARAAHRWLPPAPEAGSFLVARDAPPGGAAPPAPTKAGEAPSPSGTAPP